MSFGERSVWIFGRQGQTDSKLSTGISIPSHWGVLFSPYSRVDLSLLWSTRSSICDTANEQLGTFVEIISKSEKRNTLQINPQFGQLDVIEDWGSSVIAHINQTTIDDEELEHRGIFMC
jgi:hypothetical protein